MTTATASAAQRKPGGSRWDAIDPPIEGLVRALNAFPGIRTVASCGGHECPGPTQKPEGEWFVTFDVAHTDDGRFALECLFWAIKDTVGGGGRWFGLPRTLLLEPHDRPERPVDPADPWAWAKPWTVWALEGRDGEDPDALAARLDQRRSTGQEEW